MGSSADAGHLAADLRSVGVFHCSTRLRTGAVLDLPAMRDTVMVHVLLSGACRIRSGHEDGEGTGTALLTAGDVALLPHGQGHRISAGLDSTSPDARPVRLEDTDRPTSGGILEHLVLGEGEERAHLICAALALSHPAAPPLPAVLPGLLVMPSSPDADDLRALERMIAHEVAVRDPGWVEVVSRLVDVVTMRAVRGAIGASEHEPGIWRAAREADLARVMRAVTERPGDPWTVEAMADVARRSRSAFTERFRAHTGESPMHWVTRHRMEVARARLADGASVAATARAVGYDSEVAFRRAFARVVGVAPGRVRRRVGGGVGDG